MRILGQLQRRLVQPAERAGPRCHRGGRSRSRRRRGPGGLPPTWTVVSVSPATTWAFVTTMPGAATQPLPSMPRPQAVPRTLTTLPPASLTPRVARIPRVGGGTSASGPRTEGSGSNPRERVQEWPRRRQQPVQLPEDRRPLDVVAEHGRAGRLERDRADDPRDPERHRCGQERAEDPVDQTQSREAEKHAGAGPESLQAAREHRAGEQRAEQPEQRRVLRVRAARQHQRPEVTAEERAKPEADQRQGADDEALCIAI